MQNRSPTGNTIACFGEIMLRIAGGAGEMLLQSPRLCIHVGGAEANVAVSLACLGNQSRMISVVPPTSLGRAAIAELRRHGVDTSSVTQREGRMGLYFLTPGSGHRPAKVLYDREHSAFATAPTSLFDWRDLLQGAARLHLSGITPALGPAAAVAAQRAVEFARHQGIAVSFDCNYRATLWTRAPAETRAILCDIVRHVDLLFASERDIGLILDKQFPADATAETFQLAALELFDVFENLRLVATTFRRQQSVDQQDLGAGLSTREQLYKARAYALGTVIDRIGSGDAFAAGMLHGLQKHFDEQKLINFALAAACLKHSVAGDFNVCREEDVLHLMEGRGFDVKR